jgi:hypothetical protein
MTAPSPTYRPPSSSDILTAQDQTDALRLLLAQRKLYSRAKRWAFLRSIGLGLVAVLAPITTALSPSLTTIAASIAAIWILLSRTLFQSLERRSAERAAVVQEMFDRLVFDMPDLGARRVRVTPEEIARVVGPAESFEAQIKAESLRGWYPIDKRLPGGEAVAIAQRANAAYAERLLWLNASIWLVLTIGWAVLTVILSLALGFSLETFLLGVALPVIPPLLDTFDQWRHVRAAGKERRALAMQVEDALTDEEASADPQDLLVWQDQLFTLRRDAPQIPNLVYRATRRKNEEVMNTVAAELAEAVLAKRGAK